MNIKNTYKDNLKDLLSNKAFIAMVIVIAIAAYGFTITHFSIGIDDFGINHYMNLSPNKLGNMLQQGRLLHIAFFYLTGLVDIVPFLNNFLAAGLLTLSAIFMTALIETVVPNHFSTFTKAIFACLYISNSILSFKFIYDLDVVVTMFSYACIPLSLVYGLEFCSTSNKRDFFKAFFLLILSIGSYESFNAVYICSVLFICILCALYNNQQTKDLIMKGLKLALILICAFIAYYAIVKIFQTVTGNIPYARTNILNLDIPVKTAIKNIIERLTNFRLFFILEFAIFAGLSAVLALILSTYKKRPVLLLLFILMIFFTVSVSIIQGFLYYRTCQTFNLFVASIGLLLMDAVSNKKIFKNLCYFTMILLVLWQLKDINLWFYKDWGNYEKNSYAINNIATELYSGYSIKDKPVCFVTRDYDSFLMSWDSYQHEIGESPVVAAIGFLGESTSPELIQMFKYQQYLDFKVPTKDQAAKAIDNSSSMPAYPQEGYIKELDDIIIVKMGQNN